jgi:hypothetical protein
VKACFGTTKYCNAFLKGLPCNNPECLYLHDLGGWVGWWWVACVGACACLHAGWVWVAGWCTVCHVHAMLCGASVVEMWCIPGG